MSDWKEELFEFIRDDYVHDRRDSCAYAYYRETFEQAPAVRIKQAFADAGSTKADRADIWAVVLDVLSQSKIYDSIPSLANYIEPQRADEKKDAYNKRVAEWLRGPAVDTAPSQKELRTICAEIVLKTRSKKVVCERLMEYRADRQAGKRSLGDAAEQRWLLEDVRARAKKTAARFLSADRPSERDIESAIGILIDGRITSLLYDVGKPVTGNAPEPPRVDDIPTELVEKCLRKDPKLVSRFSRAATLGKQPAGNGIKSDMRDVAQLYLALCPIADRPVIVPVAIDAASGLGLYAVTPGMFSKEEIDKEMLQRMFDELGAQIPSEPFFAIMYHYDNPTECCLRKSEFELDLGDSEPAVARSLWDSVVIATRYKGGHNNLEQLKLYVEKALVAFSDSSNRSQSLQAFCSINGSPPKGCPEAYAKYFQEDAF